MSDKFSVFTPYGDFLTINEEDEMNGADLLQSMAMYFLSEYGPQHGEKYGYLRSQFLENFPDYAVFAHTQNEDNSNNDVIY
jgi:hypothetical protein